MHACVAFIIIEKGSTAISVAELISIQARMVALHALRVRSFVGGC